MKRHEQFLELVFGWRDSESGYGAGRHISPELKAFFEGWMGEVTPLTVDLRDLADLKSIVNCSRQKGEEAKERLLAFSNRLEELADHIRGHVKAKEAPEPKDADEIPL